MSRELRRFYRNNRRQARCRNKKCGIRKKFRDRLPDVRFCNMIEEIKLRVLWINFVSSGQAVTGWSSPENYIYRTPERKKERKSGNSWKLILSSIAGIRGYYIQSALSVDDPEKRRQEIASLIRIPDSFAKMVVVRDFIRPWRDESGILYLGIEQFLPDDGTIAL